MPATQTISMASDTHTLSEFNADASAHLERLAATGGVEVLTVNGEARAVVMSPQVFNDLVGHIEELETAASIRRGMSDAAAGRTRPAKEAILGLAAELGLKLDGRER